MDENTKVMVCLSAATAANCTPCFEHYFEKAKAVGLKIDEIEEAVDLASQVKKGAYITLKNSINHIIGQEKANSSSCLVIVTNRQKGPAAGSFRGRRNGILGNL